MIETQAAVLGSDDVVRRSTASASARAVSPPHDKVFRFLPRADFAPLVVAPSPVVETKEKDHRDWGTAIDRVVAAAQAARAADQRAKDADDQLERVQVAHRAQLDDLQARLTAAELRADLAQQRASDAEAWLARLHDTIDEAFGAKPPV